MDNWWYLFIATVSLFAVIVLVAVVRSHQASSQVETQEACEPPAALVPSPAPSPSPSPLPSLTATLATLSVETAMPPPTGTDTGAAAAAATGAGAGAGATPMETEKDNRTDIDVMEEKEKQNNSGKKKRRLESPVPSVDDKPLSPIPAMSASKSTAGGGAGRSPVVGSPTTTSSRCGHGDKDKEQEEHKPGEYQTSSVFFKKLILHEKAETFAIGGKPETTPIWICNRDDKVIDVFQGLIKRNILSVPVLLKKNSKYYGFLDLMDIVRYVVAHFGSSRFQQDKAFFELVEEGNT